MPKLPDWCDEASVTRWEQVGAELPTWAEAYRRMSAEGRILNRGGLEDATCDCYQAIGRTISCFLPHEAMSVSD